jgi:hypothetical protein
MIHVPTTLTNTELTVFINPFMNTAMVPAQYKFDFLEFFQFFKKIHFFFFIKKPPTGGLVKQGMAF